MYTLLQRGVYQRWVLFWPFRGIQLLMSSWVWGCTVSGEHRWVHQQPVPQWSHMHRWSQPVYLCLFPWIHWRVVSVDIWLYSCFIKCLWTVYKLYTFLMLTFSYHPVNCLLSTKFPFVILPLRCFLAYMFTLSYVHFSNLPLGNFSSGLPFLAAARRTSMSVHLTLARMVAPVLTTLATLSARVWKSMWVPPVLN